jgi:hypothetical protein
VEIDLTFYRDDPTFVEGSAAKRKPDVAGVRTKSVFLVLPRSRPDNLVVKGPAEEVF